MNPITKSGQWWKRKRSGVKHFILEVQDDNVITWSDFNIGRSSIGESFYGSIDQFKSEFDFIGK